MRGLSVSLFIALAGCGGDPFTLAAQTSTADVLESGAEIPDALGAVGRDAQVIDAHGSALSEAQSAIDAGPALDAALPEASSTDAPAGLGSSSQDAAPEAAVAEASGSGGLEAISRTQPAGAVASSFVAGDEVLNNGPADIQTSALWVRYWFALSNLPSEASCIVSELTQTAGGGVNVSINAMASAGMTPTRHADHYVLVNFPNAIEVPVLHPGQSVPWQDAVGAPRTCFSPGTDWSFAAGPANVAAPNPHVTVYLSDSTHAMTLVWGTEPTPATDP